MDIQQIQDSLKALYEKDNARIVFWYDADKEFYDHLPSLKLDDIALIRMDRAGALELKIRLEIEDPTGRYLLYSPYPEPKPDDDWLLDIRLYSKTFFADHASIILNELKLSNQSMRPHLKNRILFFRSQDRIQRLKKWISPDDSEAEIDLKMLAVLTRASHPDFFSILMKLFDSFCDNQTFQPLKTSKPWDDIEKFNLKKSFWDLVTKTFGYADTSPLLTDLIIRLLVTDMANTMKGDFPTSIAHFRIPDRVQGLNATVFLSQWRNTVGLCQSYNYISKYFAKKLKIKDIILLFDEDAFLDVMTFEEIERFIISKSRDKIVANNYEAFESINEVIGRRLDGYWASDINILKEDNLYEATYNALKISIQLFELRKKYDAGFSYPSAETMFNAYIHELFSFDQYYRLFHEQADIVEMGGWDVLKTLQPVIENLYSEWFMNQISLTWGEFLDLGQNRGLLYNWSIPKICNQYDFFSNYIQPILDLSDRHRVFVIISDAFRYEAAEELTQGINSKYRFAAKLEPMLGVLPSYTALGMAALLPHETISFKEKPNAPVLVDDMLTDSIENRSSVLAKKQGTAIKADALLAMNKEEGREFVKPHRVIYIYHNQIDAVGDVAATETKTFGAVRNTINDLNALIRFIINSLNGTQVMITADHGFIFQEKTPDALDKSVLDLKPDGAFKTKKRYIIGKPLFKNDKVWHGNTKITAHTENEMEFWIPKGTNRFHFAGGARFFHGGAMLQEIVVPVVIVREMKGKHLEGSEVRRVGVSLLGSIKKIVTNITFFEFIQTDAVSERAHPRILSISIRDGINLISNEETVTFDSSSSSINDRKKKVRLLLKAGEYDKKKEYTLVLQDPETKIEYERIAIQIDLAISSEF